MLHGCLSHYLTSLADLKVGGTLQYVLALPLQTGCGLAALQISAAVVR